MRNFLNIIIFLLLPIAIIAQPCNNHLPACTNTISTSSSTTLTINSGEVYCITNGYTGDININNGGTLILSGNGTLSELNINGGTLNIRNDATLSNIKSGSTGTINNCGTINTNNFNKNITINNYTNNATLNVVLDDAVRVNNFATNLLVNVAGNPNSAFNFTNTGTATINTPSSSLNTCGTSLGNSTNITNSGVLNFPNSVCIKGGTITNTNTINFNSQLYMDGGTFTNNGKSFISNLYKNNGTLNIGIASETVINTIGAFNNGGFNMIGSGCSYLYLNVPPSNMFNTNLLNSGSNVSPNGIQYCGNVPLNSAASGNIISSVTSNGSGGYRITLPNGTNAPNNGGEVAIKGVTGGNLNGYWRVVKISDWEYDLVGSVYTPVTSLSGNIIYTNNIRFGTGVNVGVDNCAGKNPCVVLGGVMRDSIYIEDEYGEECNKNIVVYDILGRIVYKNENIKCEDIYKIEYPIEGMYFIVCYNGYNIESEKVYYLK
jgi:putative hemolysin